MHSVVSATLSQHARRITGWRPDANDEFFIEQWEQLDPGLSVGAAMFGIARSLRNAPDDQHLRNTTLRHGCRVIAHWSKHESLAGLLNAQREFSLVLNDQAPPDQQLDPQRYKGLQVPGIARALNRVGLKATVFGSAPAMLQREKSRRIVTPTDDLDLFANIKDQSDALKRLCNETSFRPAEPDKNMGRNKTPSKLAFASDGLGRIEIYDADSLKLCYRPRRHKETSYTEAISMETTIDLGHGAELSILEFVGARVTTACVAGRRKDATRMRYEDTYSAVVNGLADGATRLDRIRTTSAPERGLVLSPVR